ncbi:MAG: TetR/AcrR family transcriptional regulator [Candidatus Nanopelagicales bacterium]
MMATPTGSQARTRDPARKERILEAAADLVARNGFHGASMADIGVEAGITGSGIYRHFDSKAAILVALFERVIDDLLREEQEIERGVLDLGRALDRLVGAQVEFVVADRAVAQVYFSEIHNLPEQDRRRLRSKQRRYLEVWVRLLRELRPELDEGEARVVVHAATGAIQSILFHSSAMSQDRLRARLTAAARAVLSEPVDG